MSSLNPLSHLLNGNHATFLTVPWLPEAIKFLHHEQQPEGVCYFALVHSKLLFRKALILAFVSCYRQKICKLRKNSENLTSSCRSFYHKSLWLSSLISNSLNALPLHLNINRDTSSYQTYTGHVDHSCCCHFSFSNSNLQRRRQLWRNWRAKRGSHQVLLQSKEAIWNTNLLWTRRK